MKLLIIFFFNIVLTFMGLVLLIAYILPEPSTTVLLEQSQYTCEVQGGKWMNGSYGAARHCVRIGS